MVNPVIFLALLISFVHSDGIHNLEIFNGVNLHRNEAGAQTKLGQESPNIRHPMDIEEKFKSNPCKEDVVKILNTFEESDVSVEPSSRIATKTQRLSTPYISDAYTRDKYNYNNNKNTNTKSELNDHTNKNDCNSDKGDIKVFSVNNNENTNNMLSDSLEHAKIGTKDPKKGYKNCGSINLSKHLPPTRRILPGFIENPTKQELEDYKLYQNKPVPTNSDNSHSLTNNENIANYRRFLLPNEQDLTSDSEAVKKRNVNELAIDRATKDDLFESKFMEPTLGAGIFDMKHTKVTLLENTRVCYACSTMSNPTCWSPDKQTTVKYCQKGHQSCVTKSFQHKGTSLIIRDCGSDCISSNSKEKYSMCTICHSDLCNSSTIIMYNAGVTMIMLLGLLYNKL